MTPYFSLKARINREGKNRIGVIASASVHKSAAKRNFWKRQAKTILTSLNSAEKDLLVVFSPKVNSLTKKQFKKILIEAGSRLGKF